MQWSLWHATGNPVPVAQLKQGLQEILSDTRPPPTHPVGYLTTMKRFVHDTFARHNNCVV